jgi:hypothetical protein
MTLCDKGAAAPTPLGFFRKWDKNKKKGFILYVFIFCMPPISDFLFMLFLIFFDQHSKSRYSTQIKIIFHKFY